MTMPIYEYKTMQLIDCPGLADDLNIQARSGWRLTAVLAQGRETPLGIMEREITGVISRSMQGTGPRDRAAGAVAGDL